MIACPETDKDANVCPSASWEEAYKQMLIYLHKRAKVSIVEIAYFNNSKIHFFQLWRYNSVCQEYKWHQVNILQMASVCWLYASACFTNVSFLEPRVWIWSKWKIVLFEMFHWFSFLCSIQPLPLAWLWSVEANVCASMLWHRDYSGHRPFAAPLTSFYLHMLETAGPVWAIPVRGVKIIPGPWEESCLLIQFHAQKSPSSLEGTYRLLFYVDSTSFPN